MSIGLTVSTRTLSHPHMIDALLSFRPYPSDSQWMWTISIWDIWYVYVRRGSLTLIIYLMTAQ